MEILQKTKNRVTMWFSNPTPGQNPDKTIIQKDTFTPMFTTVQKPRHGSNLNAHWQMNG